MILETRGKAMQSTDSPTSPTKHKRFNYTPERTISPIHNGGGEAYPDVPAKTKTISSWEQKNNENSVKLTSPSHKFNDGNNSPLQSFNAVMERISPKHEKRVSCDYLAKEFR